jgi:hypothetical protein
MSSALIPFISCNFVRNLTEDNKSLINCLQGRGTDGVKVFEGTHFQLVEEFKKESSKTCRMAMWSPDGKYIAWANGIV